MFIQRLVSAASLSQHIRRQEDMTDFVDLKARQQQGRTTRDFGIIARTSVIVGELLCEAVDLRPATAPPGGRNAMRALCVSKVGRLLGGLGLGVILAAAPALAAKVAVCHRPPGNPAKFKILNINESDKDDHLAHGDNVVGPEVCDGIDNDCDGEVDNGVLAQFFRDEDEDDFGNPLEMQMACSAPPGYVDDDDDCNDEDAAIHPGAQDTPSSVSEVNGIDDNCDGKIDGCGCDFSLATALAEESGLGAEARCRNPDFFPSHDFFMVTQASFGVVILAVTQLKGPPPSQPRCFRNNRFANLQESIQLQTQPEVDACVLAIQAVAEGLGVTCDAPPDFQF
jgi:hypothetical protein